MQRTTRLFLRTLCSVCLAALFLGAGGCALFQCADDQRVMQARQLALRGIDAMQQGDASQAEKLFQQALDRCPVEGQAHQHYAELLWSRGDWDQAIEHMRQASSLCGGAESLVRLGAMHLARGELEQAARWSREAVARDDQSAAAHALRGDVLKRQGRLSDSLASYHRSLGIRADNPPVELSVAEIYTRQQRPRRALSTLDSLAARHKLAEVPARVRFLQGLALRELGRLRDSQRRLAQACQQEASAEMLYHLSAVHHQLGDDEGARAAIKRALTINPAHAPSRQLWQRLAQPPAGARLASWEELAF